MPHDTWYQTPGQGTCDDSMWAIAEIVCWKPVATTTRVTASSTPHSTTPTLQPTRCAVRVEGVRLPILQFALTRVSCLERDGYFVLYPRTR